MTKEGKLMRVARGTYVCPVSSRLPCTGSAVRR
ncbi:MAG: hypothetical protein V4646_05165 [Pseudomonadota bacterium]